MHQTLPQVCLRETFLSPQDEKKLLTCDRFCILLGDHLSLKPVETQAGTYEDSGLALAPAQAPFLWKCICDTINVHHKENTLGMQVSQYSGMPYIKTVFSYNPEILSYSFKKLL